MNFWLMIAVALIPYAFMGGIVGRLSDDSVRKRCLVSRCQGVKDHPEPFFMGLLWPLALPLVAGVLAGGWLNGREDRAEKQERRKQADHERKMAELKAEREVAMDAVKFLAENGIKADVPGLYDTTRDAA